MSKEPKKSAKDDAEAIFNINAKRPFFEIEAFSRLVERVYESVSAPSTWQEVIGEITDLIDAKSIALFFQRFDGRQVKILDFSFGVSERFARLYNETFHALNPWMAVLAATGKTGKVYVVDQIVPQEEVLESRFYKEFLEPQGLYCGIGSYLSKRRDHGVVISVNYAKEQWPPSEKNLRLFELLVPHMCEAVKLMDDFGELERKHDSVAALLDAADDMMVLLDAAGRVEASSEEAREFLSSERGLSLDGEGCLNVEDRNARADLRNAVDRALRAASGDPMEDEVPGEVVLVRSGSRSRPLVLHVSPIRISTTLSPAGDVRVAVSIVDLERRGELDAQLLGKLFELTPTEHVLAQHLIDGLALEWAAKEMSVSLNTVRTHLKHLFEKTDTNRQPDLVRLLARCARKRS